MLKKFIPAFSTVKKNMPSKMLQDNELTNASNIIFKYGKTCRRWGYSTLGTGLPLNGRISLITEWAKLRTIDRRVLVFTDKDCYRYYNGGWLFITPEYHTGTVACTTTAVTGSGTSWPYSTWPAAQYYIKFGTTDVNGTGTPDTWFKVSTFDSATGATLSSTAGTIGAGTTYVIRRCFALDVSVDWQAAYTIETPGSTDEIWGIFCDGTTGIWKYTGTGSLVELSGTTLKSHYIKVYYDHILLANVIDGSNVLPQSIYWNNRSYPEDWTTGSSGYVDLIENVTGKITAIEILNQRLYVFKEQSVIEGYYSGDATNPFIFLEDKIFKAGCPNGKTLINIRDALIFQGVDNIYIFNGFNVDIIGDEISQDLIRSMNKDLAYKNFAVHLADEFLYCLFVVTSSTDPDKTYIYNYRDKSWSIWSLYDFIRSHGDYQQQSTVTWATAVGTWEDYPGQWNISTLVAGSIIHAIGDSNGYVYIFDESGEDNTSAIPVMIETKDFEPNEYDKAIKLLKTLVITSSTDGDISVQCSTDSGLSWSSPVTFTQGTSTTEYAQTWLIRGNHIRFRIRNVDGSDFNLTSFMYGYTEAGRI